MSQFLRALTALPEGADLIPETHMVAPILIPVSSDLTFHIWIRQAPGVLMANGHTYRQSSYLY